MLKAYTAFDIETTGLDPLEHEIIEIGALKVRDGRVAERFIEFIRPHSPISANITELTGITDAMVSGARPESEVLPDFLSFCGDDILIGHNVRFDYGFVKTGAARYGLPFEKKGVDTLAIAQCVHRDMASKTLSSLCGYYRSENKSAHRAYHDALATAKLYQTLAHYFEEKSPGVFEPSQLTWKAKKPQPATAKQIAFLKKLCRQKDKTVSWDPGAITRGEASRLIDSLLKGGTGV